MNTDSHTDLGVPSWVQTREEGQLLLSAEQARITLIRYMALVGWECAGPLISPVSQARGGGHWDGRGWLQKRDDQVHQYQPKTPLVQPTCTISCISYVFLYLIFFSFHISFHYPLPQLVIWEGPDHRALNYLQRTRLSSRRMIRLLSRPLPPTPREQVVCLSQSSCVSPVELIDGWKGWPRSQIIRRWGSLVLYKSFNTLWLRSFSINFEIYNLNEKINFSVVLNISANLRKSLKSFLFPVQVFLRWVYKSEKSVEIENRLSVSLFHCLHIWAKIGGYCGSTYFYECEKIALEKKTSGSAVADSLSFNF